MDEQGGPDIEAKRARPTTSRFIKVSPTPDADQRIKREAALLESVRHEGIVRFVAADTAAFPNVLITERVDGPSLANAEPLPGPEIDRIVNALAVTLAYLHQMGVVHGSIAPEHVLLRPHGQPVLCGFGYGGRVGDAAPALPPALAEFAHPKRAARPLHPDDDLYALEAVQQTLRRTAVVVGAPALLAKPPAPCGPVQERRLAPWVVGAVGGAALVLALGIWGITRRTEATRSGTQAAVSSTVSPARSTPGSTARPGSRGNPTVSTTRVVTVPTAEPTGAPGPRSDQPSAAGDIAGGWGPLTCRPIDGPLYGVVSSWEGPAGEPVQDISADGGWASRAEADPAPPVAPLPGPRVTPEQMETTDDRRRPGTGPRSTSAHRPAVSTPAGPSSLPAPSIPEPADLSPKILLPPPESLPPDVTLPDAATLTPPVSLPERSTLPQPAPSPGS